MKLVIKQCRYCIRDKNKCEHARMLKNIFSKMGAPCITVVHNCLEYAKTIPRDTLVEVELKEIEQQVETWLDINEQPEQDIEYNWVSRGMATGRVINECRGFFTVKLDVPVLLNLPPRNTGDWASANKVDVTHIRKRGKDIKILSQEER